MQYYGPGKRVKMRWDPMLDEEETMLVERTNRMDKLGYIVACSNNEYLVEWDWAERRTEYDTSSHAGERTWTTQRRLIPHIVDEEGFRQAVKCGLIEVVKEWLRGKRGLGGTDSRRGWNALHYAYDRLDSAEPDRVAVLEVLQNQIRKEQRLLSQTAPNFHTINLENNMDKEGRVPQDYKHFQQETYELGQYVEVDWERRGTRWRAVPCFVVSIKELDKDRKTYEVINDHGATRLFSAAYMWPKELDVFGFLFAAKTGIKQALQLWCETGNDINMMDNHWHTALHLACGYNNPECISYLISQDADVTFRNTKSLTPFDEALSAGHVEVARQAFHRKIGITDASKVSQEKICRKYIEHVRKNIPEFSVANAKVIAVQDILEQLELPTFQTCQKRRILVSAEHLATEDEVLHLVSSRCKSEIANACQMKMLREFLEGDAGKSITHVFYKEGCMDPNPANTRQHLLSMAAVFSRCSLCLLLPPVVSIYPPPQEYPMITDLRGILKCAWMQCELICALLFAPKVFTAYLYNFPGHQEFSGFIHHPGYTMHEDHDGVINPIRKAKLHGFQRSSLLALRQGQIPWDQARILWKNTLSSFWDIWITVNSGPRDPGYFIRKFMHFVGRLPEATWIFNDCLTMNVSIESLQDYRVKERQSSRTMSLDFGSNAFLSQHLLPQKGVSTNDLGKRRPELQRSDSPIKKLVANTKRFSSPLTIRMGHRLSKINRASIKRMFLADYFDEDDDPNDHDIPSSKDGMLGAYTWKEYSLWELSEYIGEASQEDRLQALQLVLFSIIQVSSAGIPRTQLSPIDESESKKSSKADESNSVGERLSFKECLTDDEKQGPPKRRSASPKKNKNWPLPKLRSSPKLQNKCRSVSEDSPLSQKSTLPLKKENSLAFFDGTKSRASTICDLRLEGRPPGVLEKVCLEEIGFQSSGSMHAEQNLKNVESESFKTKKRLGVKNNCSVM